MNHSWALSGDLARPLVLLACAMAALGLVGGCPAIVKLQQGTQGIGTMIAETPQAVHSLLETFWAMGQDIVLQEYIRESKGRDVRAIVIGTVAGSMPQNQQRSQLSSAYCTTSRNGGEVTTSVTLPVILIGSDASSSWAEAVAGMAESARAMPRHAREKFFMG